ncbi:MAG: MerR family transcriptional regulator [Clostridium sp.]
MNENGKRCFNTGEFAGLCRTTKETLFYYDKIGLLKPEKVKENGYRVYSSSQFFEYDLICVLKQAGSSLKEIGWYLKHYNAENFLKILKEKEEQIRKQQQELFQMEKMLKHTVSMTEYALQASYDIPKVEMQEEESLLVVRLAPGEGDSPDGIAVRLGEHFDRCEEYSVVDKFPLGSIIMKEEVLKGREEESYFFSKVPKTMECEHIIRKPAGRYAVIVHRGDYDSFTETYKKLLCYIKNEELVVNGHAYVQDLISYLASSAEENFVLKISVGVE